MAREVNVFLCGSIFVCRGGKIERTQDMSYLGILNDNCMNNNNHVSADNKQ